MNQQEPPGAYFKRHAQQFEARVKALESILNDREAELLEVKGPCRNKDCSLHFAHRGPCNNGSL